MHCVFLLSCQSLLHCCSLLLTLPPTCRLFTLEPNLLPLFQYNGRQFSSPEDCLSSPEFLDHIRKVRDAEP